MTACMHRIVSTWLLICIASLFLSSGLFAASVPPASGNESEIIGDISVIIIGPKGIYEEVVLPDESETWSRRLENLALEVIGMNAGDAFSRQKFESAVQRLVKSGLFKSIDVPDPIVMTEGIDYPEEKKRLSITFKLTPFTRVGNIVVNGAFPFLEKEILNLMTHFPGGPLIEKRLPEDEQAIRMFLVGEGYINPKVKILPGALMDSGKGLGSADLTVSIDKGGYYRISSLQFSGISYFSDLTLLFPLKTWQAVNVPGVSSRFIKRDLDADLKKIDALYRENGFADVMIKQHIEKDEKNKKVVIHITVAEGRHYLFDFKGNMAFSGFTLNKDAAIYDRNTKIETALVKTRRNILKRYRDSGYHDAEVRYHIESKSDVSADAVYSEKIYIFDISEGPRALIHSIDISGNHAYTEKDILEVVSSHPAGALSGMFSDGAYVPDMIKADINAIKVLYMRKGFRGAEIEERITWHKDEAAARKGVKLADIHLIIHENRKTIVSDITITGIEAVSDLEAGNLVGKITMKPGDPFRDYLVEADKEIITSTISEMGYPYVTVKETIQISNDGGLAMVRYHVEPGVKTIIGDIVVIGNRLTRKSVILSETGMKKGDPFSLKTLAESRRKILDIGAVETVRIDPVGLKDKNNTVFPIIQVEEKKPYYVETGAGYDTAKGPYVKAKAGDINVLGTNRELFASGEISRIGQRVESGVIDQRFLGSSIKSSVNAFAWKLEELNQDFGSKSRGMNLGFQKTFLSDWKAELSVSYESRKQYALDGTEVLQSLDGDEWESRSIFMASPALSLDLTDSHVNPRKGIVFRLKTDVSSGLDSDIDDFIRLQSELKGYYSPLTNLTLAARLEFGVIKPYGDEDNISKDQLFFLGGTGDVRGFSENRLRFDEDGNTIGGKNELLASLEARYDLGHDFTLVLFTDAGSITGATPDEGTGDIRASIGGGIGYMTPIGPVSILYGHKLNPVENEDRGRVHFSLGYTF